jgi:putative membrane protein
VGGGVEPAAQAIRWTAIKQLSIMKRISMFGLLFGAAILTILVIHQGLGILGRTLSDVGWQVLWLPVFFLIPELCALLSWWYLFPQGKTPPFKFALYAVWIGLAINWLLPVGQVGGEISRAWMLIKRQFPAGSAIASVVGDQTIQIATQAIYTLVGFMLFLYTQLGNGQEHAPLIFAIFTGFTFFVGATIGLYWLQHAGLFKLVARIASKFPNVRPDESRQDRAAQVDHALKTMYRRHDRLILSTLWRFAYRIVAAGETWLAFQFLGYPVSIIDAIILESIGQGVRSAAFFIPSGLGAQEGAIVVVGAALGIPSEIALAAALCKRARELIMGVPGLIAWQIEEGKRAIALLNRD